MLCWQVPFAEENPWQLVRFVSDGGRLPIPDRSQLPGPGTADFKGLDGYIALLQRCWAQEPEGRPTFSEVIDALR